MVAEPLASWTWLAVLRGSRHLSPVALYDTRGLRWASLASGGAESLPTSQAQPE